MKKQRLIYSLCCPFTDEVHYIGKSSQGMIRPLSHLSNSHSEKIKEWVDNLKELGHAPKIEILEYVSIDDDLDSRERYWVQKKINSGCLLLNDFLISPLLISPDLDKILGEGEGLDVLRIGRFIKEKRKSVNLSQPVFASKAGVALKVLKQFQIRWFITNIKNVWMYC